MGFKKEGMSVSRAFSGGGNNRGGFKPQPRDRLIEVISYNTGQSTVVGRDVDTGKLLEAIVDPTRVHEISDKASKKEVRETTATWQGHLIDDNMAKAQPPGSRIVLERTTPRGRPVNRGGEEYMQLQAGYVRGVPDSAPDKAFRGIITGEAYEGRFSSIQVWDPKGLDVEANEADIVAKFAQMDAVRAAEAAGEKPVGMGLQLRAIVPLTAEEIAAGKETGPQFEVIDTTEAFHWVPAKKDENGNKISEGHSMGTNEGAELITEYLGYLNDKFPEGSFGENRDFRVEVLFFQNYKASIKSYGMAVPRGGPLTSLVTTPTKCAQDDENFTFGRNWAVDGIIALTRDVAPKKVGNEWSEPQVRNMADAVFANGYRAPVSAMVRTATDARVRLHPALVAPRPDQAERNEAGGQSQAPSAAPANQPAAAGDGFSDSFEGGNAFEQAMAAGSAPAASTPAASTPADTAAPAAGSNWPSRRRPA